MITIRPPQTKEDFKAYYALRYHVLREPSGQPKGTEKDDYEPLSHHWMAVEEDGTVVGVVRWLDHEPGVAWLAHLAVAPECQKRGIGKQLVEAVEREVRALGYTLIDANPRLNASDYFKKLGFAIKELPTHYFSPGTVVWMEKKL
jgi:N-acetylglutamate synthase-like GNAT family acetyltransferase